MARALGRGARTILRRVGRADRDELLAGARASRAHLRPWVYAPEDDHAFGLYLARMARDDARGLVVCEREGGAIAGIFNLSHIVLGNFRSAYLGFYALASHAARGFMFEGIELVLAYAFREVGLHRVEANVQPTNERSIRLVERAGFTREGLSPRYLKIGGRWRDHVRFAVLADEPRRAKR